MTGGTIANVLTIAAPTKSFNMPVTVSGGMTVDDKCTWMAYSVETAPTFTMLDSSNSPAIGLTGAAW
jgi:hypothetical protein